MADIAKRNSSTDAVVQTLKWLTRQGFKAVPLRKQSKASIDEKYVDPKYNPPGDGLWQDRDLGIGVVTGPKHTGPVDIDIDCDEAGFFAARFLPSTAAVFGRKSKPRSHYLFRVDAEELPKRALMDPINKATIIEIRGDGGHQTVMPGSLHEATGELIEWSDVAFPEVPRVEVDALQLAVKKVAIAVLIVRHLWAEGQRNEICKHLAGIFYYLEWTEDETKQLIEAVMEYTGDTDRTRLRTIGITYKKGDKGGKVTGSNTLRAFLGDARLVDRILEWAGSETASLLQDYNERFAIVSVKGKFRVAETIPIMAGEPPVLYQRDDFINITETDKIEIDGKSVPKARIWLASPRRRTYKSMDFRPGEEDTSPVLNLWSGWGMEPSPDGACRAWLDLLYYTICGGDDKAYEWMLHWFANIVREPQSKSLTAPCIIGRQGAGKSLLMGYFGKILGPAYTVITNEEHIYGRFNKHLATTLLLHSEEALYGGDKKHRGIIKSLITDDYRIFEQKGVDAEKVRNHLRLALTSNEVWAAPTEVDDRRFTVIEMEDRKAEEAVIHGVLEELQEGGPAALFHYLMEMKYDPIVPRKNLKNSSLLNMKQINFSPIVAWWFECLRSGQMLPDYLCWASKPEKAEWPQVLGSSALYAAMSMKLKERGERYIPDNTSFSLLLNRMLGMKLTRETQRYYTNPMSDEAPRDIKLLPAKQYTIDNMPILDRAREAFVKFIGQEIKWPQEAPKDDRPAYTQI